MKTLADIKNIRTDYEVELKDCVIVRTNKNGTYNVVCNVNKEKIYINYVDINKCTDKLLIHYGKKDPEWQKPYWYQVTEEENEEVA